MNLNNRTPYRMFFKKFKKDSKIITLSCIITRSQAIFFLDQTFVVVDRLLTCVFVTLYFYFEVACCICVIQCWGMHLFCKKGFCALNFQVCKKNCNLRKKIIKKIKKKRRRRILTKYYIGMHKVNCNFYNNSTICIQFLVY